MTSSCDSPCLWLGFAMTSDATKAQNNIQPIIELRLAECQHCKTTQPPWCQVKHQQHDVNRHCRKRQDHQHDVNRRYERQALTRKPICRLEPPELLPIVLQPYLLLGLPCRSIASHWASCTCPLSCVRPAWSHSRICRNVPTVGISGGVRVASRWKSEAIGGNRLARL